MSLRYRLGLDLGASSVGWAVIELTNHQPPRPKRLVAAGVRIFEAGVEGSIEQGKDSSRGADRRLARLPRRQHWRTQHRKRSLFLWLQKIGLLPRTIQYELDEKDNPKGSLADVRNQELEALDRKLIDKFVREKHPGTPEKDFARFQILPYILRAKAVAGERLEPFELGRALYHLVHRRGYKSNRKADRNDAEQGIVLSSISELKEALKGRTLAQYVVDSFRHKNGRFGFESQPGEFGADNPHDKSTQIVRRYTDRDMYHQEFDRIREKQASYHPQISEEDWKRIQRILFYQRPMKSQSHLIGHCSLEPKRRRCTVATPLFQEFRLLQQVNHLVVKSPHELPRSLSPDERKLLLAELSQQGEMALSKASKLLGLPRGTSFTQVGFGNDEEEKLIGHRTSAKLTPVFGERWKQFSDAERETLTLEILHYRNPAKLLERARKVWGLDADALEKLAKVSLEEGYGSLSRQAIQKLLPSMREGKPYATARKEVYPESFQVGVERDQLVPVTSWNRDIRNPAVVRALTEMRKVVNEIIRKFEAKPETIHIELTRDLRNSRDRRKEIWKSNEDQRKRREKATARIVEELGRNNPSRSDIEKWLLAEECKWICPYTGKTISPTNLLGSHPQFDVEHIYPRRYLDDSFVNKTLCHADFNRNRKKDRLPSACLSGDEYEAALLRVRAFQGPQAEAKLRRFETIEVPEDFTDRQLNDTRYNTRLAAQYLGTLYGGRNDATGTQRILSPTGALTWLLRRAWHLGKVLSDSGEKDREDHRHHAIDAVVVALSTQGEIARIANSAGLNSRPGERFNAFLDTIETPWATFENDVAGVIRKLLVSHRPTRTLAGPLHAESNYSKPYVTGSGKPQSTSFRIRKSLDRLTEKEIQGEQIIDPRVRQAVQDKYAELCATTVNKSDRTPAKFWSDRQNFERFPVLKKLDGSGTGSPIFKVRLTTDTKARRIGKGASERQIASGKNSNYASMVYEVLDNQGQVKAWKHELITRLDAHLALSSHGDSSQDRVLIPRTAEEVQVAWKLKAGESIRLLFPLRRNDLLLAEGPLGEDILYRVQSLSDSEIQLCEHNRTTVSGTDRSTWNRITNIDSLRKRNAHRAFLSLMGEILK